MNTWVIVGSVALVVGGMKHLQQWRAKEAPPNCFSDQEMWHQMFVPALNQLVAKHSVNSDEKGGPLPARRFTVASRYDNTDLQLILDGNHVALFVFDEKKAYVEVTWQGNPARRLKAKDFFASGVEIEKKILQLPHVAAA